MGILNWWNGSPARPSGAEISQALDSLVPPLKPLDDDELAEVRIRDGHGNRVRVRHILFRLPPRATTDDRAKLLQIATTVRDRVERGEDFAELARDVTMEFGGRGYGGDLEFFERSRMVKAFEAVLFSLQAGKVSGLVETPFGYHVIKVVEGSEGAMRDHAAFRQVILRGERQRAVRLYLECLQIRASLQIHSDAEIVLREMAKRPGKRPGFWAAKRPLVRFSGGALTVGEMAELL
ncbi:peptidylprolyl isomerase, partial [Longimicrobium sp.]|uniref:peptidylprolyl isomerase n=1 Tax=Longimicrobium sp. TaxID=2029185 RepID=UPI003B3A19E5